MSKEDSQLSPSRFCSGSHGLMGLESVPPAIQSLACALGQHLAGPDHHGSHWLLSQDLALLRSPAFQIECRLGSSEGHRSATEPKRSRPGSGMQAPGSMEVTVQTHKNVFANKNEYLHKKIIILLKCFIIMNQIKMAGCKAKQSCIQHQILLG